MYQATQSIGLKTAHYQTEKQKCLDLKKTHTKKIDDIKIEPIDVFTLTYPAQEISEKKAI